MYIILTGIPCTNSSKIHNYSMKNRKLIIIVDKILNLTKMHPIHKHLPHPCMKPGTYVSLQTVH